MISFNSEATCGLANTVELLAFFIRLGFNNSHQSTTGYTFSIGKQNTEKMVECPFTVLKWPFHLEKWQTKSGKFFLNEI